MNLTDIREVEDVLLEARAAEANRRVEEFGADARVGANAARDLRNVGACRLAEGRDGVDRRDALREHRVGGELGELCRPEVGAEDTLARHPLRVDIGEELHGSWRV